MEAAAIEQYLEEAIARGDYNEEDRPSLEKWNSISSSVIDSDDSPSSGFDCNICLDSVQDPVVTLCGHLYCWPCIYKWLHFQSISTENQQFLKPQLQCPVCKAEVSEATIVPLFGRGQTTKPSKGKAPNLGIIIPRRPLGLACGTDSPRSPFVTTSPRPTPQIYPQNYPQAQLYYSQGGSYPASMMLGPGGTTTNAVEPMVGMLREMLYATVFGGNPITNMDGYSNSYHLAGSSNSRVRRHVMQADKSLGRICTFLFCCVFLCLLLF